MIKPILIVRLPSTFNEYSVTMTRKAIYDNEKLINDYHAIVVVDNEINSITFEVYNGTNDENKLQEIDKLVMKSIERAYRVEEVKRRNKGKNI